MAYDVFLCVSSGLFLVLSSVCFQRSRLSVARVSA